MRIPVSTDVCVIFLEQVQLEKTDPLGATSFNLVRLRRKPSIQMLADLFDIAPGTASRIFITWILFLKKELSFLLSFPTVAELKDVYIPASLASVKNLRGIVDCTEFSIEKPCRISSQRSTFSAYNSRNTFKLYHINIPSATY